MDLLDLNKIILSKDKTEIEYPIIKEGDFNFFKELVNIDGTIKAAFDSTDNATIFFKGYADIKELVGTKAVDVFYAYKLGYFLEGVPMKLVYILTKAYREYSEVNMALNSCIALVQKYANNVYVTPNGSYTVKDIIDNIAATSTKLITEDCLKVEYNNYFEVYIKDTRMVALIPSYTATNLSQDDINNIKYDKEKGLVLHGLPLRISTNTLGATLHDYDLRECV